MYEELKIDRLIKKIKAAAKEFPDERTGKNTQYEMEDAAMGAFSVFFTQCASFLEYQEEMKRHKGRCNAESLFDPDSTSPNQSKNSIFIKAPLSM